MVNNLGVYGKEGTAASTNAPGGRSTAISWTDSAGNFWLFGGYGYGSAAGPTTSTTSGNIARARGRGPGSTVRLLSTARRFMGLAECPLPVTFPAPAPGPYLGSIRPGIYGCSAVGSSAATTMPGSMICGCTHRLRRNRMDLQVLSGVREGYSLILAVRGPSNAEENMNG